MAELLVRTIDKDQPDLYLACQCLGRGDIVVVCEDGHKWSDTERNSPHWTIIEVPGASVDDFSHFMTPGPGDRKLDRMLRRRPFKLDLDAFDANIRKMTALVGQSGHKYRPHVKAHKSSLIGRRQLDAGAIGLCCATIREAEVMAEATAGLDGALLVTYEQLRTQFGDRRA